jgi:hypothetical protein
MKLNFYFIILFPIFIVAQNNLFFERVLNFSLSSSTEVVVPDNRAWNVKTTSKGTVSFKSTNPEYGSPVLNDQSLGSQDTWLGEGDILIATTTTYYSILEYRVVPVSTNTGTSESTGFSSSGLEFNQVINISGTAIANSGNIVTTDAVGIVDTFTVPDNKVWKVESAYGVLWGGPLNNFFLAQAQQSIQISGSLFKVNNSTTSGETQFQDDIYKQITLWVSGNINGGEATGQNTPIWLPSGTYKYQVHSDINSQRLTAYLSAVEFNVNQ